MTPPWFCVTAHLVPPRPPPAASMASPAAPPRASQLQGVLDFLREHGFAEVRPEPSPKRPVLFISCEERGFFKRTRR